MGVTLGRIGSISNNTQEGGTGRPILDCQHMVLELSLTLCIEKEYSMDASKSMSCSWAGQGATMFRQQDQTREGFQ